MYEELSDMELVQLLKSNDEAAFNEIYKRFQGLLYVYACRITREENEAEDIVQEVFIYLWDKRTTLMLTDSLAGWLYQAVRYRFFDRLDRRKVRTDHQASLQDFLDQGAYCPDEYLRERELAQLIEKGIAALPAKMQEIFALSRKEQLSHKEIASRLHLSEKTVKNQVHNALRILKTRISMLFSLILLIKL
ncbi:RNA polymerase sigma-70 factor [Pseudoflavitalea sp. X16]|nr:RNA polymerase sigma-70 factor [Paraflavitalea devenefica]